MKIWLVNHYAVPPSQNGGTRHYSLSKELIDKGHDVLLIASSYSHATHTDVLSASESHRKDVIDGVPFLWLKTPAYSGNTRDRLKNVLKFTQSVCARTGLKNEPEPDVIIGSSQHLFACVAAYRLARHYKVPFVFEVRDLMPQTLIDLAGMSKRHPIVVVMGIMERYLYRRAARIITLLPRAIDHMVDKGAAREKIVWLPNGVNCRAIKVTEPLPDDVFTIIYAGSHGQANGLDSILDAAVLVKTKAAQLKFRIRMIGSGPEKERLQKRAQDEKIEDVVFEAPVSKEQIFDVMQEADAFIVTLKNLSLYRWGMSLNKLFDYMASARPVLFGADIQDNPIETANAGITFTPEDADAMADAIIQLAGTSSEERWQMGLRGRGYVEEHHDFVKLAGRLEDTLASALKK